MEKFFKSIACASLEIDYDKCDSYIQNITNVLVQYSWIYSTRNVDIFLNDVLEKIPLEWVKILSKVKDEDLWQLPFSHIVEDWPASLTQFIRQAKELAKYRFPKEKFQNIIKENNHCILKKTSDKKQLEIEIMSHLINQICSIINCNIVLDIGSGLGYLNQALHYNFNICSIGLDSMPKYTSAAKERLKSDHCRHSVIHETLEVKNSEVCLLKLENLLDRRKDLFCNCKSNIFESVGNKSSVVMVGLHSCGSLMQDMMKLFCKLKETVAFICVGCCYNKIDLSSFPMSKIFKSSLKIIQTNHPSWKPCISGLRLAAHGTRCHSASSSGKEQEKNLFYRAILECFIKKENIVWKQPKRHIRSKYLSDFPTYVSKMFEGHIIGKDENALKKLNAFYKEKEWLFERIRILLVLQTLLQPLWEIFVTLDRVMYFREKDISAEVLALWDDKLSSRNLAICAYKNC